MVSPDGKFIVSVIEEWGSGKLYLTTTQLAQSIPEFGSSMAITVLAYASIVIAIVVACNLWYRK